VLEAPAGLVAHADPGRFDQMVDNLLVNALRHGQPPVTVSARAADEQVLVSVTDSGPGVSRKVLPRLFERYGTSSGGTGLGLYIVRQLALAHDGDAWYDEDEKAFVISLPRDVAR
jgi:signal transduction histidine kinase